jgi:citrate lyase subunit beta / citryl-CoA lyase
MSNLRRSALYVPGDSEKMIRRSAISISDMLLLNLEDGIALSRKDLARDTIANALKGMDFGNREKVVRINGLSTDAGQMDLAVIAPCKPDGICLPKVENSSEIRAADSAIGKFEAAHAIPAGSIQLHAMIESAAGVLHAEEIAHASPRVSSLIFGSADYASDLRCQPGEDRGELLFALQMIVHCARSAGIDAIDAPCFDLKNHDLLIKESTQARRLGFTGKSALHPDQLSVINKIFDVTNEEIVWAKKVLAELDAAENRGRALSTMEGQLIDNPHRRIAERILNIKKSV